MSAYFYSYSVFNSVAIIAMICSITFSKISFADEGNTTIKKDLPLQQKSFNKDKNKVSTAPSKSESTSTQDLIVNQQSLVITLYPQHERVSLIDSKGLINFWPNFFGRLSAYLDESTISTVLKQFLSWKRTQDLFVNLKALEELQLSLSNHLLILEHGQALESDEIAYKEKLLSLLTRLELQNTHLAKDREWREQEQLLKNRLSPLNDLWHADESLKNALEPLITQLNLQLNLLNTELDKLDEIVEDMEEKAQRRLQPSEQAEDQELTDDQTDQAIDHSFDQILEEELLADYHQELKEKTLEIESAFGALQIFYKAISNREERLKKCIESLERLTFDSAELLRSLPELISKNEAQLRHVKLLMAYWTSRNQLEHKYKTISIESLLSRSTSKQNTLKTKWKSLLDLNQELKDKFTRFKGRYIEVLQNSSPPKITANQIKNSYAQTKHAYDTAQSFLTFHRERAENLKKALDQGVNLKQDLDEFSKSLRLSWDLFIENDVTQVLILRAKPLNLSNLSVEILIEQTKERNSEQIIKKMLQFVETWEAHSEELDELKQAWQNNLKDDQKAIVRLDKELNGEGGLTHRLVLEQTWLEFIKEIEVLDGPALLAKHNEALSIYVEQKKQVQTLKEQVKKSEQVFKQIGSKLELMSDPLLRQHKSEARLFEEYAHEIIVSINKLDPDYTDEAQAKTLNLRSIGEDSLETKPTNLRSTKTDSSKPNHTSLQQNKRSPQADQSQKDKLERVQSLAKLFRDRLPPRLTHYRQYVHKVDELKELFSKRKNLIENLQGELAKRVEYARQVRRTASVIRQRVLENELPNEAMTTEIENYGQREWVEQLRAEDLEEVRKRLAYDQYRLKLQPQYKSLLKPLDAWRDLLNNILDLSNQQMKMISEATRAHGAKINHSSDSNQRVNQSVDTKMSLAERQFAHQLRVRIDSDYPWYDFIWSSFNSDQVIDIEDLLKDHYVELLQTEMTQSHLESRIRLTKNLAELVSAQRPLLESYQNHLETVHKELLQLLKSQKLELWMQIDRQKALVHITQKDQMESLYLDYLALNPLENQEEREQALSTLEQVWAMQLAYQAALEELEYKLGPQGTLEVISGEVNDAISQLETERDELTRPLLRLLGKRARGADLKQDTPQVGEIDRLHQERIHSKLTVLVRSLLSFLLIPLITLLSLRAINGIERRIKKISAKDLERLEREGEILTRQKRSEREDRLTTLLQVMKTTSKLLIYTVATGAMLKTLQVDVTPIIASAGIIGLAFAFGAQELVKDFFAGVFILFENQYNKGDYVTINGIFGWIDKITLRLTVIRDSHGVIHFIPNGQVQLVSNHNKEWSQAHLEIGASYSNPPKQVIDCLRKLCMEVESDPIIGEDVLGWEVLGLERFDDSAVVYRVHLRTAPKEKWRVARHYRKRVMEIFAEQNIEIPFPQLVVSHPSSSISETEQS
ncbi:MAG: hypothetical protein CMH49_06135 [Myxococcales bacterium]|nr:hypothetical protein [Myxococcales bacterium]